MYNTIGRTGWMYVHIIHTSYQPLPEHTCISGPSAVTCHEPVLLHTLRRLVPTHGYCGMSVGTGVWI